MENQIQSTAHRLRNLLLVLSPAILILVIQYIWKMAYIGRAVPAIYWLFVFLDRVYFLSILGSAGVGIFFLFIRGVSKSQKYKLTLLSVAQCLFFFSIATFCTFPIIFAQSTVHMQSVRAEGKVYYMGAYPMFDINFYVAECESLGIICQTIYRSGDIMDSNWEQSKLNYDEGNRILELQEPEKGIIFSYQVPKR